MHSSDSSLALLCTPTSLPSPPFHTTEVRDPCVCVCVCTRRGEKELKCVWGEAVYLLSPWCCQVCGVEELRQYVPYLTLLQTGPDISFHPWYKCVRSVCVCPPNCNKPVLSSTRFLCACTACVCMCPLPCSVLLHCSIFIFCLWRRPA